MPVSSFPLEIPSKSHSLPRSTGTVTPTTTIPCISLYSAAQVPRGLYFVTKVHHVRRQPSLFAADKILSSHYDLLSAPFLPLFCSIVNT